MFLHFPLILTHYAPSPSPSRSRSPFLLSLDSSEAVNSDDDVMEDDDEDVADDDEEEEDDEEGMEALLREGDQSPELATSPRPKKDMSHIAATAESLQPKGYTLATTKVSRMEVNLLRAAVG